MYILENPLVQANVLMSWDSFLSLHPSIEHFHIPFSLFSVFVKSLRYYKLICLAQAGTRRQNDVIQTSTCSHLASTPISCHFDVV